MKQLIGFFYTLILLILMTDCNNTQEQQVEEVSIISTVEEKMQPRKTPLSQEFKSYWYNGEAEISSFKLSQERYGEIREGSAVLIFVTEDFLPEKQVKADNYSKSNTPILKLNSTKKFNTGIYPYSIMESSFYPVGQESHALKISASIQEWCGQVYSQINNREQFEILSHSYFEREADESYRIEKTFLENEIWNLIRINPSNLPIGTIEIIPSLEYSRLRHRAIKAYQASALLQEGMYTLTYPDLGRKLVIYFNPEFPYDITAWEESNYVGYGGEKQVLTTKAKKIASIRSPYWSKNRNSDLPLREKLGLN